MSRFQCSKCGGSGSVRIHQPEDYGISFECEECSECWGTGKELPAGAIHVDVCPECETPTTYHGLDAPGHCPHEYERRVPVIYVPLDPA